MPSVTAQFSAEPLFGTAPLTVTFTDLSTDVDTTITGWAWDFGDGAVSVLQNPTHTYVDGDSYDVELIVTDGSISDTETKAGYVVVDHWAGLPQLSLEVVANEVYLRWVAYGLANVDTDYEVWSDEATPGTFVLAYTKNAGERLSLSGEYGPYVGVLTDEITKDSADIHISGGDPSVSTDFENEDWAKIEGETVQLDHSIDSNVTFPGSRRGVDYTIRRSHAAGTTVLEIHEVLVDTTVSFGARHVIRYKLITVTPDGDLVPVEGLAVNPTLPPTSDHCMIWGVINDTENLPLSGIAVSLIPSQRIYNVRTGEVVRETAQTTTTDTDGYFEVIALRDVAASRTGVLELTVDGQAVILTEIPDENAVNYLECYDQ